MRNLKFSYLSPIFFLLLVGFQSYSQVENYWEITSENTIRWDLTTETRLPHFENIEMAGRKVATIIYYGIDSTKNLTISRDVIFPQLRTYNKSYEPDWRKYRAYYRQTISHEAIPSIISNNKIIVPQQVDSIEISGKIKFYHTPIEGLLITRTIYPSMEERFIVEEWEIKNISKASLSVDISTSLVERSENGYKGTYTFRSFGKADNSREITSGGSYHFPIYFGATINEESSDSFDYKIAKEQRKKFLQTMSDHLVLDTPSELINTLFYFSKIRASESIFDSSMGLVHSPGGGNYYVGIWANDQIEYSGPFYPYLGYERGNEAGYNAYAHFGKNIPTDGSAIPYAFEVDGIFPMDHLERGDAAMIAYGTSHYVLASGDPEVAKKFWPLIEWSLDWCENHRNSAGAVISESDEMEGRIETGTANLSTSSLYYGGLKYSMRLAEDMGLFAQAKKYEGQKKEMESVIFNYFGAELEGVDTYRYFDGNKYLRHWICLPLSMGIDSRKEGTIEALLNKLWTDNGILVELNPEKESKVFWDRATMYALQGIMKVGETEKAYSKLYALSKKRLLGDHVPYMVEAYPENNMKHLSAESALYCRIFTEGLLGIEPIGSGSIKMKPTLPAGWVTLSLERLGLFGKDTDINIVKKGEKIHVLIKQGESILYDKSINQGTVISVKLVE